MLKKLITHKGFVIVSGNKYLSRCRKPWSHHRWWCLWRSNHCKTVRFWLPWNTTGSTGRFSNKGKLQNCVVACDIPKSVIGTFEEKVCIAMGLLISELSDKPWKWTVFSFGDSPKLHKIEVDNIRTKCEFMRQMECAEKLDFLKIYSQVLHLAIARKLLVTRRCLQGFLCLHTR